MDDVSNIKARLPIEQLVGQYCQLTKKGRNFVCVCPFHNDTKPSFLVSPDKGIGYCFACQTGGDIFSFYQAIEGVDFPQAIKELAEKAGVQLETKANFSSGPKKDEKERARECLEAASQFYRAQLGAHAIAQAYLERRGMPVPMRERFEVGVAPDSFQVTYEHLLKLNFSRKEILAAGLGVQKELQEERIYDRFRHRLMFPIKDQQGQMIGFGGRTLGDDDAKYINSSDGILFHKGNVLYALDLAKETIREKKNAILVEGYFDVVACHQAGVTNAVATCGTALTESHVKLLKRYTETVTLCMDQDKAGQDAMDRSFPLLCAEGVHVKAIVIQGKDPSEMLLADPAGLKDLLENGALPYLDVILNAMRTQDLSEPGARREALRRMLTLVSALPSMVERQDYLRKAAGVFQTSETALEDDLRMHARAAASPAPPPRQPRPVQSRHEFSSAEIALGIFLYYPKMRHLMEGLIPPEDGLAAALYTALKAAPDVQKLTLEDLALPDDHRERAAVLLLFCEEYSLTEWSEGLAVREIKKNCISANKDFIRHKQLEVTKKMVAARAAGNLEEEALLRNQYQEVLKLAKLAS
jgi:DNA primase